MRNTILPTTKAPIPMVQTSASNESRPLGSCDASYAKVDMSIHIPVPHRLLLNSLNSGKLEQMITADARQLPLKDSSVDLTVTSPPYFMQVIYRNDDKPIENQMGLETTPTEYVDELIAVTREIIRVSKPTASIFVNLGDKYCGYTNGAGKPRSHGGKRGTVSKTPDGPKSAPTVYGIPNKSLMAIPQRYAIRCIDELGLILRAEIIWQRYLPEERNLSDNKNRDRARRDHETWFHFTLKDRYYADHAKAKQVSSVINMGTRRSSNHPAVFPPEWTALFIDGWCPPDGVVFDPFLGSGTVVSVAEGLGRHGVGTDLGRW